MRYLILLVRKQHTKIRKKQVLCVILKDETVPNWMEKFRAHTTNVEYLFI